MRASSLALSAGETSTASGIAAMLSQISSTRLATVPEVRGEGGHILNSVYQFLIAAQYQFTTEGDSSHSVNDQVGKSRGFLHGIQYDQ